jgi:hypothetical protein
LSETRSRLGRTIRLGIRTHSQTPRFDDAFPADLSQSFASLLEVSLPPLAVRPVPGTVAKVRERFHVNRAFGDRDDYDLTLTRPGRLRLRAVWRGTAASLALILNGPGQVGYYARKDGGTPLAIDFELTPALLQRGENWRVSIVNFGRQGSAQGLLFMEYPVERKKLAELTPAFKTLRLRGLVTGRPSSGAIERTFTEDGSVEIRYPDGTIKRIFDGGHTIISPDGTAFTAMYIQAPPPTPPSLPNDAAMIAWLEWSNGELLGFIRTLVGGEDSVVEHYLQRERQAATTVYQQMRLRTKVVDDLLTPQ